MATLLLNHILMITSSILDTFYMRLPSQAELSLVLFLFLFPAIWGAVLAGVAFFQDLNSAARRARTSASSHRKVSNEIVHS